MLNWAIPRRDLLRTADFLPSVTSLVAAGLGFRWLFQTTVLLEIALVLVYFQLHSWGDI